MFVHFEVIRYFIFCVPMEYIAEVCSTCLDTGQVWDEENELIAP